MLQQTQVKRVLAKYPKFLRRFPTLSALARSRQRDVVLAWQGMGYNNRAVRLHRLAVIVVRQYKGRLPADEQLLRSLPGIGKYTARAVLGTVFRQDMAAVDINAHRVLSRMFWKMHSTTQLQTENSVWTLAESLLPPGRAYQWNQALMDLGATVCTARQARCSACPLCTLCRSQGRMTTMRLTRKRTEPTLDGIPNRIYRGRIVNALRQSRGTVRLADIGKTVHNRFSRKHHEWLQSLVATLEKDGLVKVRGRQSFGSRRLSLA